MGIYFQLRDSSPGEYENECCDRKITSCTMNRDERARTYEILEFSPSPTPPLFGLFEFTCYFLNFIFLAVQRVRYIFFFFNILTPGRESITRSSDRTKFANSWSEINISSHVIAIIPRDFMGASISADCYRQSHDAHLIFNAIGNVESNNSHFCPSPFLCPSVSFYISPIFFFLL